MKDRRELQRNVKGFITLSKYLLRGSRHENSEEAGKSPAHDRATTASPQVTV
jgi:hypothetical protein